MSALLRRLSDDRGTTLPEIIIVSFVSMTILAALLSMLDSGAKTERRTELRHTKLLELRSALGKIDKDARQATRIKPASTNFRLDICTYDIDGMDRGVVYEISGGELTRRITPSGCAGAPGTPTTLATNVTIASPSKAFCFDPPDCVATSAPIPTRIIRVTLAAEPDGSSGGPITLATDIHLRNPQS